MSEFINIETDLNDALKLLDGLDVNQKRIRKNVLSQIGTKAKNAAKKSYSTVLNKRSGNLYKSIRKYMYKNGKATVVTAHNKTDPVRYGFMLAAGETIEPKNGDYLTFEIGGKWVKVHSVTIEPRDFIEQPVKNYLNSAACERDLDAIMQKQIQKIEEKGKV